MRKFLLSLLTLLFTHTSFSQTTYTFNGNGNWSDTLNWIGHVLPPEVLTDSSEIIIDPVMDGDCILDTFQLITGSAKLTLRSPKTLVLKSELVIRDSASVNASYFYFEDTATEIYTGLDTSTYEELVNVPKAEDLDTTLFPVLERPLLINSSHRLEIDMPPAIDQGKLESCLGWSLAAVLSYLHKKSEANSSYIGYDKIFSGDYIWNQKNSGNNIGFKAYSGLGLVQSQGSCKYVDMPQTNPHSYALPLQFATENADNYKIGVWAQVSHATHQNIKKWLDRKYPIIIGLKIDKDFKKGSKMSFKKLADGRLVWINKSGKENLPHAMVICGYDQHIRAYKVLNSYGRQWGNDGYFWLDYNLLSRVIVGRTDLAELYIMSLKRPAVTVTTKVCTNITSNSAESGGTVVNFGGANIIETGICYSINYDPTTASTLSTNVTLPAEPPSLDFTSSISELSPNSYYYARAYARTDKGIVYGNQEEFQTPSDQPPGIIEIKTNNPTMVTLNSAKSGGVVVNDGGNYIIKKGICWNTSPNPTVNNFSSNQGPGKGRDGYYLSLMNFLNANTTYYIRAYVTTGTETVYGNEVSFTTSAPTPPGSIKIGSQIWMTQNLDVTNYRNGDPIPQVQDRSEWHQLTTGAWCYYENTSGYGPVLGKLYNWYAVNDPRGLAPVGWHVPAYTEWLTLVDYLGGTGYAGGRMKEESLLAWAQPNYGADNSSGFTARGGGYRDGSFSFLNFLATTGYGYWWSATSTTFPANNRGYYVNISSQYSAVGIYGADPYHYGMSVRCIKD